MKKIRVLIADDQELVRMGLEMILNAQEHIEVVGLAENGERAIALARALKPDVCLFDIRMPITDGIAATEALAGRKSEDNFAIVVITTFDLDDYVYRALKAGARGFLLKGAKPEMLVEAIEAAASGNALIAPSITARLLKTFASQDARVSDDVALSAREEEVLLSVAKGRTNTEIAAELFISLSTVKSHIASLMRKLNARNRVEVAIWAYETRRVTT